MQDSFRAMAQSTSRLMGTPWAFLGACTVVVLWAVTGPLFGFSDTWQLVINTGTTIVTFLMVFLIQNTQNRDAKAIQLKLDELLRGVTGPRTSLVALEELSDAELDDLQQQFTRIRRRHNGDGEYTADTLLDEARADALGATDTHTKRGPADTR